MCAGLMGWWAKEMLCLFREKHNSMVFKGVWQCCYSHWTLPEKEFPFSTTEGILKLLFLRPVPQSTCSNYGRSGQQVINATLPWEQLITQHHPGESVWALIQTNRLKPLKPERSSANQMVLLFSFNTVYCIQLLNCYVIFLFAIR